MRVTAIIAEDEPILRAQLKTKLGKLWPELQIVADVGDGELALEAIAEHRPQLAFLDIQMPEMTGVEVARSLAANRELKCHIVFVTAFDEYAVEAFEANAVDYVLKPYSDARLQAAVDRLKDRLASVPAPAPQDLGALVASIATGAASSPEASASTHHRSTATYFIIHHWPRGFSILIERRHILGSRLPALRSSPAEQAPKPVATARLSRRHNRRRLRARR